MFAYTRHISHHIGHIYCTCMLIYKVPIWHICVLYMNHIGYSHVKHMEHISCHIIFLHAYIYNTYMQCIFSCMEERLHHTDTLNIDHAEDHNNLIRSKLHANLNKNSTFEQVMCRTNLEVTTHQ